MYTKNGVSCYPLQESRASSLEHNDFATFIQENLALLHCGVVNNEMNSDFV